MTARVVFEKVSRWYGPVMALNDVSFELGPGVHGLLGPNGAGKSSLLRLASGQIRPSQGSVTLLGHPAFGSPGAFHSVGLCPDTDALFESFTGLQFVTALLSLHGLGSREAEALATEAIETVDLRDAMHRKVGGYSKGMRQRIKLAQALAHKPAVLFLDEPLTGMDPLQRRRTIRFVKDWAKRGRHVIVSSHILHEIEAMTSNILLITNGRILAEGNVHQIRELIDTHPHTVHVKAADPRALAARVLHDEGVTRIAFDEGTLTVETRQPDRFYQRLTELAASGEAGTIAEVTSPDDNLQAVFSYLVRQ